MDDDIRNLLNKAFEKFGEASSTITEGMEFVIKAKKRMDSEKKLKSVFS